MIANMTRPLTTENRMLRATGGDQITLPRWTAITATNRNPTMGERLVSQGNINKAGDIGITPDQAVQEAESDAMARQEAAQLSRQLDFAEGTERDDLLDRIDTLMTQRKIRVDTRTKEAVAGGKMQTAVNLAEKYADLGLKFDRPMTEDEARLLADDRKAEIIRNALISMTPGGVGQTIGMFGAGLAAMAVDPLEVASTFIPVAGQATKAAAVLRFGRVGGRVAVGVTEGAVGSALTEPVYMGLSWSQQLDYTMGDALFNVGLGGVLGGGIGGVAGVLSRRVPDAPVAADQPRGDAVEPGVTPAPAEADVVRPAQVRTEAVDPPPAITPERAAEIAETRALAAEQRPAAHAALRQFVTDQEVNVAPVMPVARQPTAPKGVRANLTILYNDDLATIGVDAQTFQFKSGGDDSGVTDRLRGVATWDSERAGVALIYEYADGRRFIVDGHQRLALAKRLAAEGQQIDFPVRVLREADGVTIAQARARAAIKNIAEGTGTPLDAAKVLRDLGGDAAALNLPPNSSLVRQGEGLSRLDDRAFGMVVNEKASETHGALVGRLIDDPELHADILALVTRLKPKNAFEAEGIIRQAREAGATRETQASLFGDEVVTQSLFLERARILDQSVKRLREDRATFNVLLDRSERITGAGNTLDPAANAKRLQESGELMQYVQRQANMKGPISDALKSAAEQYKRTGKPGPAVTDFIAAVRAGIERGDLDGDAGRAGRGDVEPVAPPPSDVEGPSLFALTPDAPQSQAAEIAARAQQSKMRRLDQARVESDDGGLFGGAQNDMFAPRPKPADQAAALATHARDSDPLADYATANALDATPDRPFEQWIAEDLADREAMISQIDMASMSDEARADMELARQVDARAASYAEVAQAAATCVARLS